MIENLKIALAVSVFYLCITTLIFNFSDDFTFASSALDWCFRILIIVSVSAGIILLKKRNGGKILIGQGFKAGLSYSFFLSIFFALSMFIFSNYIKPDYTDNIQQHYRSMQYQKMMSQYVYDTWNRDTITSGAIDTVNTSLDKYLDQTKFFFTNEGQVFINYLYCLIYGLVTALTVSMLIRKE